MGPSKLIRRQAIGYVLANNIAVIATKLNIHRPPQASAKSIKDKTIVSFAMLTILLSLVIYSVFGMIKVNKQDELLPKVVNGAIDLSGVDFANSVSIPLEGGWRFYWQALLAEEQALIDDKQQMSTVSDKNEISILGTNQYAVLPHAWLDLPSDNDEPKSYGFATYRLHVKVSDGVERLALRLPVIGSAHRVYINEKLLTEAGIVGSTPQTALPGYRVGVYSFDVPENASTFSIIIHVSNYDSYWGGIWDQIRLASFEQLYVEQSHLNFRASTIIAAFLTIAVFNLIQFSLRTKEMTPLMMALLCLLLALREVGASQILALMQVYYFDYTVNLRISFLTFYLSALFFIVYFYQNFRDEYSKLIVYLMLTICSLFSIFTLLTPTTMFTPLMLHFRVLALIFIAYTMWGLVLAVIRKRFNANLIFVGTFVLAMLVINDIILDLRLIDSVPLVSFGLVGLIICQSYATYRKFIMADEQNKGLSIALSERNIELEQFSQSLERQVETRTSELLYANEKLEVLAFKDSLTGALNRRGLMQHIDEAQEAYMSEHKPFSVLLIDFDHFKQLNDIFGHEIGDKVLAEGSQKMLDVIENKGYLGRWGGEELLILLNNTQLDKASVTAEKLRLAVEVLISQSIGTSTTISIGAAEFSGAETIDDVICRADNAMYRAKELGRNRVELAALQD